MPTYHYSEFIVWQFNFVMWIYCKLPLQYGTSPSIKVYCVIFITMARWGWSGYDQVCNGTRIMKEGWWLAIKLVVWSRGLYTDIDKILFLWFIAFRQLFCQNKGIFVSKPVNYDNFLWKKPQHIIYCCKRNLEQNLNILILEHLIQEGDILYALSA